MRLRGLLATILVGTAPITATACSSEHPQPPERLTACELVTPRQVATALGGPVGEPARAEAATDTLAGRSGCAWSLADGARAALVELVRTNDMSSSVRRTGFSAAARFNAVVNEHGADELSVADGRVGDRSIYVEENATLHVLSGRSYLTFEVAATPPSAVRPIALDLARRAIDHLRRVDPAD